MGRVLPPSRVLWETGGENCDCRATVGSSAILVTSGASYWRRGGGEDPWLCKPRLSPGLPWSRDGPTDLGRSTGTVKHMVKIACSGTAPTDPHPGCTSGS